MSDWQQIEDAPAGNAENGPFFDVIWAGEKHRYLPVDRRVMNCYRRGNTIMVKHGYPAVTTIFHPQPTHFMQVTAYIPSCSICGGVNGPISDRNGIELGELVIGEDSCCQFCSVDPSTGK